MLSLTPITPPSSDYTSPIIFLSRGRQSFIQGPLFTAAQVFQKPQQLEAATCIPYYITVHVIDIILPRK